MKNTDANDEGQPWHREDDGKVTTRQLCWPNLYDNTLRGDAQMRLGMYIFSLLYFSLTNYSCF